MADEQRASWSAPGRVVLVGDHTDHDGGLALPLAIGRRTTVRARRHAGESVHARSDGHRGTVRVDPGDVPGSASGWGAYVAGLVHALRADGRVVPGASLEISGGVPPGAGLSSSHALLVAAGATLLDLAGEHWTPEQLSRLVQRAENDHVGTPSGVLDQTALLHARAGHLLLVDAGPPDGPATDQVPCDLAGAGLELLVVDTRAPHALADGAYATLRDDVRRAARTLGVPTLRSLLDEVGPDAALEQVEAGLASDAAARRRARHVVTENARVREVVALCRAGSPAAAGRVLTASHDSQRHDLRNTVPAVDLAVDTLAATGALGARMTGGGFGGSVVALVPTGASEACGRALAEAYARAGLQEPLTHVEEPADGARREDC